MNIRYSNYTKLLSILLLSVTISCQQEPEIAPHDFPYVLLKNIDVIPNEGINVKAELVHLGDEEIIEKGFVWSTDSEPTLVHNSYTFPEVKNEKGNFEWRLKSGLTDGTKYYMRAYVTTASQIVYSNTIGFLSKGSIQVWIKKGASKFIDQEAAYFTSASKAYFIARNTTNLSSYDPVTNALSTVTALPENSGTNPRATSSGNTAYVLLNAKVYTYTISTNTWQFLTDYPYDRVWNEYSFFFNNTFYIGSHSTGTLYGYSITGDEWDEKQGYTYVNMAMTNLVKNALIVDGKIYLMTAYYSENSILEYNPVTDTWSTPFIPSWQIDRGSAFFTSNDKLYWGLGSSELRRWGFVSPETFSFDPTNDSQQKLEAMPPYGMVTFRSLVLNGKAYIFASEARSGSSIDELWEYNLSLEE